MQPLSVAKFGGTSVADFPAMQACANILQADPNTRVVVLSASAGVTNLLVALAQGCEEAQRRRLLAKVVQIQENILSELSNAKNIREEVQALLEKITQLSARAFLAPSPMLTDELISQGEMISSLIFVHLLQEMGLPARWVDVRDVIATDSQFGQAIPQDEMTKKNSEQIILPLIEQGNLVITQGFIGRDPKGFTTTLGRGGSDYSAALLAEVLGAKDVLIWTDVAGIYTTDPRTVPLAQRIESISFAEAAEMATFGAKVLHPATLRPAVRSNIPVYVGSSKAPKAGGTWVTKNCAQNPAFRAIALRRDQTLLTLSNIYHLSEKDFLAKTLALFAQNKIPVETMNSSALSLALTLDSVATNSSQEKALLSAELLSELSQFAGIKVNTGLALIALVGNNLHACPALAKQIFAILTHFNIRMMSDKASANNVCLLAHSEQATDIVRALHKNLFEKGN